MKKNLIAFVDMITENETNDDNFLENILTIRVITFIVININVMFQ